MSTLKNQQGHFKQEEQAKFQSQKSDQKTKNFQNKDQLKLSKNSKRIIAQQYDIQKKLQFTKKKGHWTYQQKKLYIRFLKAKKSVIGNITNKRKQKFFQEMSQLIQTRSPKQCVSHHQKMIQSFSTIERIIQNFNGKNLNFIQNKDQIKNQIELQQIKKQGSINNPCNKIQQYIKCQNEGRSESLFPICYGLNFLKNKSNSIQHIKEIQFNQIQLFSPVQKKAGWPWKDFQLIDHDGQ